MLAGETRIGRGSGRSSGLDADPLPLDCGALGSCAWIAAAAIPLALILRNVNLKQVGGTAGH
jgi:hypothetical protein